MAQYRIHLNDGSDFIREAISENDAIVRIATEVEDRNTSIFSVERVVMTRAKAKELSLKVWEYLAGHPEIKAKEGLPGELYNEIRDLYCMCPLCDTLPCCRGCPLKDCMDKKTGIYYRWTAAGDRPRTILARLASGIDRGYAYHEREKAAREIVRRVKAWKPKERDEQANTVHNA